MKHKAQDLIQFLQKDIWETSYDQDSRIKSFSIKQLKILLLAARKFDQNHSRLQAASMTYYSILALVPTLTLIYGLMKGFGLQDTLQEQLYHHLSSHREFIDAIFNLARSYVNNTQGTVFAAIGLALLLWSIFKTLNTIEEAFNDIWGIKESKTVVRKLSDYLAVLLICPLLIILSGSVTVYVSTEVSYFTKNIFDIGPLVSLVYAILFFLPFIVLWMVFTFFYIFMPNTKVNFLSGLWGGLVAGTLYQVTQWCYILFQAWITRMNAIYGSLAAFPLFLGWLQISWMIMLFGAEVAFARQYLKTYEFEPQDHHPSPSARKLAGLLIMYVCVKDFEKGLPPRNIKNLSEHLHLPVRLGQEVTFDLIQTGLLSPIRIDDTNIAYQPARTINAITVKDVLDTFEHGGQENIPSRESPELKTIQTHLERLYKEMNQSEENILIKDL
jgi:membrane protein